MSKSLNQDVKSIEISGIRQITDEIKTYSNVVSLTIGEPDFPTPSFIKQAAVQGLEKNMTFYAPTYGLLETREAASRYINRHYGLTYDPRTEIIVTNGTTESLFLSLRTILSPGDEVIVPTPAYPGYKPVLDLCGARFVPVDTTDQQFKLTKELLTNAITPKTKAVLLTYPSNPTGAILTHDELKELVPVIKEHDLYVISDELYSELTFDQQHTSIGSFSEVREQTIIINGLSKSHAMTGWRIGFTFASEPLTKEMVKVHQYINTSVNTVSQFAAAVALDQGDHEVSKMREEYKVRRDFIVKHLNELGFRLKAPDATFYAFPDLSPLKTNAEAFFQMALKEARVGVLPSTVFTFGDDQHLRLSFASSLDKLELFVERLSVLLSKTR
ncbi:aminotransferase class I/II-fold pyridoxal phosphate-dependent enzyme [Pullulanibacillus sp. KACC 23026]|uniref:aminotransferase class I/II-fold pyridoxal phosphate-dependent enzyme n=1 Tax=Pullulanibacillus sp. KACC 23026 TaxID=3028315 RepID=UPI0023B14BD3|nr:aminotransferase class I/II-fold pyridoxal phosphate-dependent enzyme [Pullulanibacillus sp. KACC 23026]WEG14292.1 aminotransferase class I/II-fold pyridoxal phosphate-dependent enzyme [Pullulanibacillus sp. KACC 23026]